MSAAEELDKRLLERKFRQGQISRDNLERHTHALPDLAENVHRPDEEELERVRGELELEQRVRNQRIERAPPGLQFVLVGNVGQHRTD